MAITARYWRVWINSTHGPSVNECAFLDASNVDLSTGGTASALSQVNTGAQAADKSFDKNLGTAWVGIGGGNQWLAYDHGTAVDVARLRLSWTSQATHLPSGSIGGLRVQYSSDGTTWSEMLLPVLVSGDFVVSTTADFDLISLADVAVLGLDGALFPFAGSALPSGMPVTYIPDGAHRYRDFEFGGFGRIAGTVKEDGTPDVPVKRRVRLHREQDGLLVREVWSDPVTGAYSFDYIDATKQYTVITYDYEHDYRAVIADNITPEAMP